jgi:hypothetical protein
MGISGRMAATAPACAEAGAVGDGLVAACLVEAQPATPSTAPIARQQAILRGIGGMVGLSWRGACRGVTLPYHVADRGREGHGRRGISATFQ